MEGIEARRARVDKPLGRGYNESSLQKKEGIQMELVDAKTIVNRTKSLNNHYLASEYVMNIYRGCSHGCIYCFARSAYYNIDQFDRVRAKRNALQIIRDELRRKVKGGVIGTGGMSDPYNPQEKEHLLTRHSLELVNAFEFGISLMTKSDLVLRDVDILTDIKTHSPVNVSFTITCADDGLCKKIEPNVALSSARFRAINALAKSGIIAGVLLDPVLPYITDTTDNIREMVKKAKACGAAYIYISTGVTMEGIQREHFYRELDRLFPGVSDQYRRRYKDNYHCRCPRQKKLWEAFVDECEKQQILYHMPAVNYKIRAGYDLSGLQMRLD